MPDKIYIDVILPVAVPNLYTYHYSRKNGEAEIKPGMRVCVQFGKRKLHTALVVSVHTNPPESYKTKEIISILDEEPVILPWQIDFWRWLVNYYMCTPGDIYSAALPGGLRPEGQTQVFAKELPGNGIALSPNEQNLIKIIENNPGVTIDKIGQIAERKQVLPTLRKLNDRNLVSFEESLQDSYHAKTVEYLLLHPNLSIEKSINELLNHLEKRAPKQLQSLLAYLDLSGYLKTKLAEKVKKADVIKKSKTSSAATKALIDKKIFIVEEIETSRLNSDFTQQKEIATLSEKQSEALISIKTQFEDKDVVLLHGVTSSGKTEIYIHLIEEQLKSGKQVLYLLPEIALTTQIITRLRNVFGNYVGVYHSKFSDAERVEVWNNLLGKKNNDSPDYKVILGVRSSIFLPFNNLGLIIVDEEHENTYKQFDPAPRYHARDASVILSSIHKAKVLLGSATPSLESFFNAKTNKYGYVELFQRHMDIKMPEIQVVDIRQAKRKKQMSSNFSPQLIDEIRKALNNEEQIILFQNRRGFSPYLECADCGWIPSCPSCDVSLTYHKAFDKLICHYCGHQTYTIKQCKACGSLNLQTRGFGTEKIEDDLKILFPDARLIRMDLDSTRKKRAYEEIIDSFDSGQVDILIGTQMVTKGLDFNNVSVVGVLNADNMLNYPDFRAFERSFQLMAQVSGRAGRKYKQGKVIIQTSDINNPIIKQVVGTDYDNFFSTQLAERKAFNYPPYTRLINITIKHKQNELANKAANDLASMLRKQFGGRVLGPQSPVIGRVQNWYLKNILVKLEKSQKINDYKRLINRMISITRTQPGLSNLQILIDVDPY